MTHAEIAGVLGCSRRHVGNLIERLESQLVALRQAV
jgi:MarR-like DNA-binding transcriptional regulator SgrR of sgrS sRNA